MAEAKKFGLRGANKESNGYSMDSKNNNQK